MALSANTVFEIRNGGSDTNSGGFVTGASGTDWSLQNAAQYSVTDGVTAGTTTITSATAAFGTDVVGNLIYVQGGTGSVTAGWYQIVTRTNATTIVVDRSTGLTAGTGVTLKIGGAFASPGIAGGLAIAGNIVYIKYNASPYSITSASTNVAGGCISNSTNARWVGYDTTRTVTNTDANRPILQLNVSTATIWSLGSGGFVLRIAHDGNSQTASRLTTNGMFIGCSITGFNTASSGNTVFSFCTATANSASVFFGTVIFCEAYSNTATPYSIISAIRCLSYNNSGASTDGFGQNSFGVWEGCIAYGNGRDGFAPNAGAMAVLSNCIAVNNARYGFNLANSNKSLSNCAHYNNTSGGINSTTNQIEYGTITLSADPFSAAGSANFALNTTAGGGAALRALGYPATFPAGTTASYGDVGAAQHLDAGGGGVLTNPGMTGGMR